jgi:hypothetical protein
VPDTTGNEIGYGVGSAMRDRDNMVEDGSVATNDMAAVSASVVVIFEYSIQDILSPLRKR